MASRLIAVLLTALAGAISYLGFEAHQLRGAVEKGRYSLVTSRGPSETYSVFDSSTGVLYGLGFNEGAGFFYQFDYRAATAKMLPFGGKMDSHWIEIVKPSKPPPSTK